MNYLRISIAGLVFIFLLNITEAQIIPFRTREDEAEFNRIQLFSAKKNNHTYVIEDLLIDLKETPLKIIYVGATRHGVADNFISIERPESLNESHVLKILTNTASISMIESEELPRFVVSKSAGQLLGYPSLAQKQKEFMLADGNMFATFIQVSKIFNVPLFITPKTIAMMEKIHVNARSYSNLTLIDVYRDLLKLEHSVSWAITICEAPNMKIGDIAITSY